LFRRFLSNGANRQGTLPRPEKSFTFGCSAQFCGEGALAVLPVKAHPFPDSLPRDAERFCRQGLGHSVKDGVDSLSSQVFLSGGRKTAEVGGFHTSIIHHNNRQYANYMLAGLIS
jgi:hypothetical protein